MNTHLSNLEFVREACIKANPSLLKLEFGCEVKTRDGKICKYVVDDQYANVDGKFCFLCDSKHRYFELENFEILGKEPTLSDVLFAIGMKKTFYLKTLGRTCRITDDDGVEYWDLSLPFSQQSEETLAFLRSLLEQ